MHVWGGGGEIGMGSVRYFLIFLNSWLWPHFPHNPEEVFSLCAGHSLAVSASWRHPSAVCEVLWAV